MGTISDIGRCLILGDSRHCPILEVKEDLTIDCNSIRLLSEILHLMPILKIGI